MFIIDAHEDIAYNALEWDRDIRLSAYETRKREEAAPAGSTCGDIAMSGLPELRRAGVALLCGVIFAYPCTEGTLEMKQGYCDAEGAYRVGQQQLAYYRSLAQEPGVSLVLSQGDLRSLLAAWEAAAEDAVDRPLGIIPLLEGADPIRTPAEAASWFADGVRIVGLAWTGTRYSGGTRAPGPLTPAGRELLAEMDRLGMILDISHLAEESFWQALELFKGTVIASHSNCRSLVPTDRHLSDEMIKALVQRNAVIGMVPTNAFLHPDWSRERRFPVEIDQLVRHIDHICQLTGSARHVGIGSDIDGGFGLNETPEELETVADLVKVASALLQAGYKEEDVAGIMGGNWRSLFLRALPI